MLLLRTEHPPDEPGWQYEIKLDGYRALAIKANDQVQLFSRNGNDFTRRYPRIAEALTGLPRNTVVDGESVALDAEGRPPFRTLQNYGAAGTPLYFYIFDLLFLEGRNVMRETLEVRRSLLEEAALPKLRDPIRYSPVLNGSLSDLVASVRASFEGLVAKRRDSIYEPGLRSGTWMKMRVNQGQELVIAGYAPSAKNLDALITGHYEGDRLIYAARTGNRFTPSSTGGAVQGAETTGSERLPIRQPPGKKSRPMGSGPDGSQDGGMLEAQAAARRPFRVRRVDSRSPPQTFPLCRLAERQEGTRGSLGMTVLLLLCLLP